MFLKATFMLTRSNIKKLIAVFQHPIVAFAASDATDLTEAIGVYCHNSSKPNSARLWVISSALGFHSRYIADYLHMPARNPRVCIRGCRRW